MGKIIFYVIYHQTTFREVQTRHFDGSKMFVGQILILLEFFEVCVFFQKKKKLQDFFFFFQKLKQTNFQSLIYIPLDVVWGP